MDAKTYDTLLQTVRTYWTEAHKNLALYNLQKGWESALEAEVRAELRAQSKDEARELARETIEEDAEFDRTRAADRERRLELFGEQLKALKVDQGRQAHDALFAQLEAEVANTECAQYSEHLATLEEDKRANLADKLREPVTDELYAEFLNDATFQAEVLENFRSKSRE